MRKNDQNSYQSGYPQGSYPGGTAYPGYPAQQGYQNQNEMQNGQGYQSYPQAAGYTQMQGYQAQRNYQTPQVPGGQTAAGAPGTTNGYTGQGLFPQNGYAQTGYTQPQAEGYAGQNGYTQPGYPQGNNGGMNGYAYPAGQGQPPAGSYIPQTPYSPGYSTPGYQAPTGYQQGYSAYTQMGQQQAPANYMQEHGGQVPLNGGGYVPQPVPVRKAPFMLTDTYLLIICAVLLALFALGMFVPGMGMMKIVFLILAAASTAALWLKHMTDNNKRLCFSVVFGLLMLVTVIGFITGGQTDRTTNTQQQRQQQESGNISSSAVNPYAAVNNEPAPTPAPTEAQPTPAPGDSDAEIWAKLDTFMNLWAGNEISKMVGLCDPVWQSRQENVNNALFKVLANRTPTEYSMVNISGTPYDTSRTITINVSIDKNNGKPASTYEMAINMNKSENDGQWYVDPSGIITHEEPAVTVTPVVTPTSTPDLFESTPLYYNPDKGSKYHRDENCQTTNKKYLPFKGKFTYGELLQGAHPELEACHICGAPDRPKN